MLFIIAVFNFLVFHLNVLVGQGDSMDPRETQCICVEEINCDYHAMHHFPLLPLASWFFFIISPISHNEFSI